MQLLIAFLLRGKFPVEHAWLNVVVVLVFFAGVFSDVAGDLMKEELADRHARVNLDRLHGKHFERPITAEANVAEAGRHVHKEPEPADGTAALNHRHEVVSFGALNRAAEVELIRREDETLWRNVDAIHPIALSHIEHHLFVDEQFVVQREVVAIWVEMTVVERLDDNVAAELLFDLVAGEDHEKFPCCSVGSGRHSTHGRRVYAFRRIVPTGPRAFRIFAFFEWCFGQSWPPWLSSLPRGGRDLQARRLRSAAYVLGRPCGRAR